MVFVLKKLYMLCEPFDVAAENVNLAERRGRQGVKRLVVDPIEVQIIVLQLEDV